MSKSRGRPPAFDPFILSDQPAGALWAIIYAQAVARAEE
jgi:hypothetical protein